MFLQWLFTLLIVRPHKTPQLGQLSKPDWHLMLFTGALIKSEQQCVTWRTTAAHNHPSDHNGSKSFGIINPHFCDRPNPGAVNTSTMAIKKGSEKKQHSTSADRWQIQALPSTLLSFSIKYTLFPPPFHLDGHFIWKRINGTKAGE